MTGEKHWNRGISSLIIVFVSLVLGAILAAITLRTHILLVPPAIVGIEAGFVLAYTVWQGALRNIIGCALLAVLSAVLLYVSYRIFSYIFTADIQHVTLFAFLQNQLDQGALIGSVATFPIGATYVRGNSLLFYWLLDFAVILLALVVSMRSALRRPFCAHCQAYYGRIALTIGDFGVERLGQLDAADIPEFTQLMNQGQLEQAGKLIQAPMRFVPRYDLLLERCATCQTNPIVLSVMTQPGTRGRRLPVLRQLLKGDAYNRITAFTQLPPPRMVDGGATIWLLVLTGILGVAMGVIFVLGFVVKQ